MMKIKLFLFVLFGIFLINLISANNISLFPNPGISEANLNIQYSFNFTNSTNCNPSNNILSYSKIVLINSNGVGFVSIDISNLTQVPTSLCEGKDGLLRANHSFSDIVFNTIYAKNLNLSGNAIIKGRLAVNGTTLFVNTNGRVGIGTTSPGSGLDVRGAIRATEWTNASLAILWVAGFNATGDTRYYLRTNPFGFYNSSIAYTKIQVDNNLTTRFYSRTQINTLNYYNSSDFVITNYYLKSNPFGFWNSTKATFNKTYADTLYSTKAEPLWSGNRTLLYLKSNPFGFYNSSTLTEHDPKWSANITNYYTKALDPWSANRTFYYTKLLDPWSANRTSYYTKTQVDTNLTTRYYTRTNPFKFWNATFALFNKTYADTLYSTKAEPLWSGNRTSLYLKSNPFGFYNSSTLTEHDPKWSANISSYYTKALDPWSANRTSYYTKTDINTLNYYNSSDFVITDYYLKSNPFGFYNSSTAYTKTQVDNNLTTRYVPYIGASSNINFGVHNLTINTNTNTFFVNTNGRVGIGTMDPIGALDIAGGQTSAGAALGDAKLLDVNGYINSPYVSLGEYQNFLLQTEYFDSTTWVKTNIGTVTANNAISPDGTLIAENIPAGSTSGAFLSQVITNNLSTGNFTFSIWLRAQSGTTTISLKINSSAEAGTAKSISLTTAWKRYSVTQNFASTHTSKTVYIISGTNAISAFGAQLEKSSSARVYSGAQTTGAVTAITRTLRFRGASNFAGAMTGTSTLSLSSYLSVYRGIAFVSTDGLISYDSTASTAAAPIRMSPRLRLSGTVWDTGAVASRTVNWKEEANPIVGAPATSELVWGYGYNSVISTNFTNRMVLSSEGTLSVFGTTFGSETLSNGALTSGTNWSVANGFILNSDRANYTHNALGGTLTQSSANFHTPAVGNRWYKFTYTTSSVASGCLAYIGTEFASKTIYLPGFSASAGTYTVFFKSTAAPGNFVIYATSTAGSFRLDDLSLTEVQSGDIIANGLFTGGGTSGIKIDSSGNVGIGTSNPKNPLNVIGNANITGVLYYKGSLNPYGFYNSSTLVEHDPKWSANITNYYTKLLDPWSANRTSYYTKTQVDNNLTTRYVPYTGANSNVNLGAYNLTALYLNISGGIILNGNATIQRSGVATKTWISSTGNMITQF